MTVMTRAARSASTGRAGGCGCGGGCGGGCAGGASATSTPAGASAFVRPRFFGGMLLTEDDLQAATDYVVGKRRLTNRYVLGTGRGVRARCRRATPVSGDRWSSDRATRSTAAATTWWWTARPRSMSSRWCASCGSAPAWTAVSPAPTGPATTTCSTSSTPRQPTEPVAPYADDNCAVGDCEFSRVQEGYRFELSCDPPPDEPTLIDIVRECVNVEDEQVKEDAAAMAGVVRLGLSQERDTVGGGGARADVRPRDRPDQGRAGQDRARQGRQRRRRRSRRPSTSCAERPRRWPMTRPIVRAGRASAGCPARVATCSAPGPARSRSGCAAPPRWRRCRRTSGGRRSGCWRSPSRRPGSPSSASSRRRAPPPAAAVAPPASAPVAAGETPEEVYVRDAARLKTRVLRGLEDSGRSGCREYREISALKFKTLDQRSPYEVRVLGRTFLSVLVNCVCGAANPRCPTCTDARVPLARVRVEGCDVVSICDLERRWVHSPRALAYWFPIVEELRQLLEGRCCPDDCEGRYSDRLEEQEAGPGARARGRPAACAGVLGAAAW